MAAPLGSPLNAPRLVPLAETLAAALPPLLVQAERVAATVAQGVHGRRRAGPGDSFWQFRRYQSGDPAQSIDWRQSAKADRPFVREHEWSAAQTVGLWCAHGPGMDWRSAPTLPTKAERATVLLLALAALLAQGGERLHVIDPPQRLGSGHTALLRLAEALAHPARPVTLPSATLRRHATAILIGDFLEPLATIETAFKAIAARGCRGHLLQVLDPAEESLPFEGRIRFTDMSGGESWLVNRTEDVRAAYIARLTAHRAALADMARALGWTFAVHHTNGAPQTALMALHQRLSGMHRP